MRLSEKTVSDIVTAVGTFVSVGEKVALYLYGSRTDDTLKGGDIDLLLLCENAPVALRLEELKIDIVRSIKNNIGERRIDLTVSESNSTDPFITKVSQGALLLANWI